MSGKEDTPIFPAGAHATPVAKIKPPAQDPRRAKVHRVHQEIAAGVRDGSLYEQPKRKSR